MNLWMITVFCAMLGAGLVDSGPAEAPTRYRVYFLGGQSNMEGFGHNQDLPPEWGVDHDHIRIFVGQHRADGTLGGEGFWSPLGPGYGTNFQTDRSQQQRSDRFGPELTLGLRLDRAHDAPIALIKFARSGSALAQNGANFGTWDPEFEGPNQLDSALNALSTALGTKDIDGDGAVDQLIPAGIFWMQGESDAIRWRSARHYGTHLDRVIGILREALGRDDLPVVIGKITDSGMDQDGKVMDHHELVQRAQADFTAKDSCAAYVTKVDDYQHSADRWHYTSEGYLRMGRDFADAMIALEKTCGMEVQKAFDKP